MRLQGDPTHPQSPLDTAGTAERGWAGAPYARHGVAQRGAALREGLGGYGGWWSSKRALPLIVAALWALAAWGWS